MKVTTKGQVTIPQDLRTKVGIVPGSEVEFFEDEGRLYLQKVEGEGRGRELVRRMRGRGSVQMSTDDILALTRGPNEWL
jgi:antitoxin PrlF